MRTLWFLFEKETKQILRNSIMVPLIILLPTLELLVFPFAATFEIKDVRVAIVDQDNSSTSRELTQKISSSGYFKIKNYASSYEEALDNIEKSRVDMIVEIPRNFGRDILQGRCATIQVSADAVDGTKGSIGSSYINAVLMDFAAQKAREKAMKSTALVASSQSAMLQSLPESAMQSTSQSASPQPTPPQITVTPQYRYNALLNYKTYMVPGLIVIMLTLVGCVLTALNIVSERELGTLEQINVSPVKKAYYLLGKLIPFWIIGIAILLISLLIAWLVYGIEPIGSVWTIILLSSIYMLVFSGFGLLISVSSNNMQRSMFIAFFFLIIFFLIGGLFTPISSMPQWAQWIAAFNPAAYFIEAIRLIVLKGSTLHDLSRHLIILSGFAILFNGLTVITYHKVR
ncbi:MAG: ABC transporter permease [Bacteroidales bacterium]|jgi:ABC-2 type transport system permease protein|nr:ABC transporter permease [Bacteroidales bacterium]